MNDDLQYKTNTLLPGALIDRFITILNRAVAADRDAMTRLVKSYETCNEVLGADPTIQCGRDAGNMEVGPLGIINGLCGIDPATGYGAIQGVFDGEGRLLRFERCPKATLTT